MTKSEAERLSPDSPLGQNLRLRAKLLAALRAYFDERDYLEVETPHLCLRADPAIHLRSFQTVFHHCSGSVRHLYLPTSPEHHMKRMLAAGHERIYQLGRFYRDGELGTLHNPEFTGLEWYTAGDSIEDMMEQTEDLVRSMARIVCGTTVLRRGGREMDLAQPFQRMSMRQALMALGKVEVPADWDEGGLRQALKNAGLEPAADDNFDDLVNRALVERVEPALQSMGPVFLCDYPAPMAALARLRSDDPQVAERFELFIGGLELCDAYGELCDAAEQRRRFTEQLRERRLLGLGEVSLDEALMAALERGMPASAGNALGVDRLLMLFAEAESIEEVMAFGLAGEMALV